MFTDISAGFSSIKAALDIVKGLNAVSYKSTCQDGHFVPVNPELHNVDPSGPAPAQAASIDPADELAKLGALKEKGLITQAEFDAQKAKLLAQ